MSLAINLANFATRTGTEFKTVKGTIGTLANLTTTEKSNIVGAINEVKASLASGGNVTVDTLSGAGTVGKTSMKATTQAEGRAAIGAGTSSLALGTTSSTAKAGDYAPSWAEVTGKPAFIGAGATAALARSAIGAGTSDLALGTTSTTAKAGDYVPTWLSISNMPTYIGAGNTPALARTAIGAGTSDLTLGTTSSTAKAGNYAPLWSEVTSKPAVIAAGADMAAARSAIGAGTSNLAVGTAATDAKAGNYAPAWSEVTSKPAVIAAGADAAAARSAIGAQSAADVDARISGIVGGASAAMDTLGEIEAILNNETSQTGTIVTALGKRVSVSDAQTFTETEKAQARSNIDVYSKAELGNPEQNLVTVFEAALV